jgi:DNA (cytosine-5)-methyltransferase 1
MPLKSLEICAGAGGQALGLEKAGFEHVCLVEIDKFACGTLRLNRPKWNVLQCDLKEFSAKDFIGIDLLAGGVPCPPFSKAGQQLGKQDDRDLFPTAIRLVSECRPRAVMLENVRGLLDNKFSKYREWLVSKFSKIGYIGEWKLLNASQFTVPQLRPRAIFVAFSIEEEINFTWPKPSSIPPLNVGDALFDLMSSSEWKHANNWREQANNIAPTLVGGSKKHGGPDLGPTRARNAWKRLGVNGMGIADEPPDRNFVGFPKLTLRMTARLQGFPDEWKFNGGKTAAYRQIGNAFPPPVALAVGCQIKRALLNHEQSKNEGIRENAIKEKTAVWC